MRTIKGISIPCKFVICGNHCIVIKFFLALVSIFFLPNESTGQGSNHPDHKTIIEFISEVQTIYGVDDELVNGYPYYPPDQLIGSHPYFKKEQWYIGTVYMNGETFTKLPIKYDLTKDAFIIKATLHDKVMKLVQLNSLYVDSARINNQLFVHSRSFLNNLNNGNFYEQIYNDSQSDFGYFIRYTKKYLEQYTSIAPKGRFSDINVKQVLLYNEVLYDASNRRKFLKPFSRDQRGLIKSFLRKNDIKYKRADKKEIKQLMEYCNQQIIN